MEIGLWITQFSLMGIYGAYGIYKTLWTENARKKMSWAGNRSETFVRFVGIAELLGASGVVFPMLTNILEWLTPLAAIGLTLIQIFAILIEHLPKKEYKILPLNIYFMAMSIFVLIGRWSLFTLTS